MNSSEDEQYVWQPYERPRYSEHLNMNTKRKARMAARARDGKGEKATKDLNISLHKDEHFYNADLFIDEMIMRYGKNLSAPTKHIIKSGPLNLLVKTEAQRLSKKEFASYDFLENHMREDRYLLDKTQFEDGLKESYRRSQVGDTKPVSVRWIDKHGSTRKAIKALKDKAEREAAMSTLKRKGSVLPQLRVSESQNLFS